MMTLKLFLLSKKNRRMFYYSFVFINYYIRTASVAQTCISFQDLLKNASLEEVSDVCSHRFTQDHEKETVELWKLHQGYQNALTPIENKPLFPFLLIPLFKIKDHNNVEVHYTFFEGCNFNVILNFGHSVFLGEFDDISVEGTHMRMYYRGKDIVLNQSVYKGRNGYFIFKEPNSDCAMLYYGVLIDSYIFRDPCNELTKLYKSYILKKNFNGGNPECVNSLDSEDITIELQFDTEKLNKNREALICHEQKIFNSFLIDLRLNKFLLDIGFKVILKGKIKNNNLYFEVYKYYGQREIKDIHVTMNLQKDEAREFYKQFKQSLRATGLI